MVEFFILDGVTRNIGYGDFIEEVNPLSAEDALVAIAKLAWHIENNPDPKHRHLPVFFAQLARAVLIGHRNTRENEEKQLISKVTFDRWYEAFRSIHERPSDPDEPNYLNRIKIAVSFEGFGFQDNSFKESIGRHYVLYCRSSQGKLNQRDWTEVVGVTLEEYFHIWISLLSLFRIQDGLIGGEIILGDDDLRKNFEKYKITESKIDKVINKLSLPPDKYRDIEIGVREGREMARFDPNPLLSKPIVRLSEKLICVPIPDYLNNAASNGLYYGGVDKWTKFSEELGDEFEAYIGDQFKLLGSEKVQRVPKSTKGEKRCDWIVMFKDFNLLVEVKIQRMTALSRAGGASLGQDIEKIIGVPQDQINSTAQAIQRGDAEFKYIHGDHPLRGLIVGLEPFYLANSLGMDMVSVKATIPTTFASSKEVEDLVSPRDADLVSSTLRTMQNDSELAKLPVWEVLVKLRHPWRENPIISEALNSAPWAEL